MKKRFFYGKEAERPQKGGIARAKLFVLTEEGYFHCKVNHEIDYSVDDEAHDFKTFDPTLYKWDGFQEIVELNEEQAKSIELEHQNNWVSNYLSWRDNYRYIGIQHLTSHYLGVNAMDVVLISADGVYIPENGRSKKIDPKISKEGVYECLVQHIINFEAITEIHPKLGPIGKRPVTRTIFGRVILQPEDYNFNPDKEIEGMFYASKHTLENIRWYLRQKNTPSQ